MNPMQIIRAVAALDLVVTAMLAITPLARVFVKLMYRFDEMSAVPAIPPIGWLFINLAGILGVLWALVRIAFPLRELAIADAVARCVVAVWIVFYVLVEAVPYALFLFVATEVVGAGLQWVAIRQLGDRSTIVIRGAENT